MSNENNPIPENTDTETDTEVALAEAEGKVDMPRRFAVLLHNDDFTTMEFVVEVLKRYFGKSEAEAAQVMLEVHEKGKGVAGVYSRQIAETKVVQVLEEARKRGFPLKCSAEPE